MHIDGNCEVVLRKKKGNGNGEVQEEGMKKKIRTKGRKPNVFV